MMTRKQEDMRVQENIGRQQLKQLSGDFERTKQTLETGLGLYELVLLQIYFQAGRKDMDSLDNRLQNIDDSIICLQNAYQTRIIKLSL